MPKGYVILTETIHDPAGMAAYSRHSGGSLAEHGGRVLVVDDDVEVREGTWPGSRTVVIEYDSVEQARAWYESAGYQAAIPLRQAAADCNVIIAAGFAPRAGT
ncbi:hypothetical protein UG55_101925 [Frankia sp. EI5c]|uniref:DUF1330 domain-containing protein n=1 Tax=Frankia sp. EI5c TaxID=683316 RepID=UPI0007C3F4C8|nr:DUF1330 domain-containing protein [Frankia sp. EI5c]OAA25824.1 hypothetical protein UG55_101925 [Frankia sp. EI5c]